MPQLIKPTKTTVITNTKAGECQVNISLDLNINLNSNGVITSVSANEQKQQLQQEKQDDKVDWEIGDFSPPKKKVKFGKSV